MFMFTIVCNRSNSPQEQASGNVSTNNNPADRATRWPANIFFWLTGSAFLVDVAQRQCYQEIFCLAEPNLDPELQSEITTCVTSLAHNKLSSTRFERFSTWSTLWRLFLCWNTLQNPPARCLRITPVMDGVSVKFISLKSKSCNNLRSSERTVFRWWGQ